MNRFALGDRLISYCIRYCS